MTTTNFANAKVSKPEPLPPERIVPPEVVSASRELKEMLDQDDAPPIVLRGPWEGRALPGLGFYRDMPMQDYLALPFLSAGRLEKLRRSPLQYRYAPARDEKKQDERELGSAVHLAILEPGRFKDYYVVLGQCCGYTKGKNERCRNQGSIYREQQSWCKIHDPAKGTPLDATVEVISQEDFDATVGMRDAVLSHERARSLFEGKGDFEVTVIFDDPDTGVRCKIRPDRLIERAGMNVDIKTTYDAAEWSFPRQAEVRGYFRKLAFYRRGLKAMGWPYESSSILAIESGHPFDMIPYLCDEDELDSAELEVMQLLSVLRECMDSDRWPGYATDFVTLYRPFRGRSLNQGTE